MRYLDIIVQSYKNYASYMWQEITFNVSPWWQNYFYWLIIVSALFFGLELLRPWRENQPKFRKDFWLDFFYMFFNFFLFSLIIFNAASNVFVNLFNDFLGIFGITNVVAIQIGSLPAWTQLIVLFIVRDFVQWNIHRLLHRVPWLWEFHKVHHSVEQMGFAAQMRYHWMENVVYNVLQYLPLAMIGFSFHDFFIVYMFAFMVGHYNHSNISVDNRITAAVFGFLVGLFVLWAAPGISTIYAILIVVGTSVAASLLLSPIIKYIFNSPEMHIWHHAYDFPESHPHGINFGLTLSCWDYIFGTAIIPHNGRDIKLGFPGVEEYPKTFLEQNLHGIKKKN